MIGKYAKHSGENTDTQSKGQKQEPSSRGVKTAPINDLKGEHEEHN
jgi:hypothetical protein